MCLKIADDKDFHLCLKNFDHYDNTRMWIRQIVLHQFFRWWTRLRASVTTCWHRQVISETESQHSATVGTRQQQEESQRTTVSENHRILTKETELKPRSWILIILLPPLLLPPCRACMWELSPFHGFWSGPSFLITVTGASLVLMMTEWVRQVLHYRVFTVSQFTSRDIFWGLSCTRSFAVCVFWKRGVFVTWGGIQCGKFWCWQYSVAYGASILGSEAPGF